jgi:hypothetical protein
MQCSSREIRAKHEDVDSIQPRLFWDHALESKGIDNMFRKSLLSCSVAALASVASADVVNINGSSLSSIENTGASFWGSLQYDYDDGDDGVLTVTLTNTTSSSVGGYLTGFVFDITSTDNDFEAELGEASNDNFKDTGSESANPFGNFDAGAAIQSNWSGGGNPALGLAAGQTGIFEFEIEASDASSLTASSFLGEFGNWFAVRFRGLNNGGSDKVLGNTIVVVPLPATALAGVSMLGICLGVRTARRRRT